MMQLGPFVLRANDCAIWCLSTFLSRPYEEVVAAAAAVDDRGGLNGMDDDQMIAVARHFGVRLRIKATPDLEEDTGILGVKFPRYRHEHAVVLWEGRIFDMRGRGITAWKADAWLASKRGTPTTILVMGAP
jgi:hypothetical protein